MRTLAKLGRGAVRIPLALGLAFSVVALAAGAAQAEPVPQPWKVNYHHFGSATGSFVLVFTNLGTLPLTGEPAPFQHPEFQVTRDTCTATVAPGGRCKVTVSYAADGQPIVDGLQMQFTAPDGQPVAAPPVQLFAGGAQYVATHHASGVFTFPAQPAPSSRTARSVTPLFTAEDVTIQYFGVPLFEKVDLPPDTLQSPFSVVSNTCTIARSASCKVTLQFAPTASGQYVSDFHMTFENAQTGASVPTQDVTLVGNA